VSKALELIERVGQEPTLDVALDRDPSRVTEGQLIDTIRALRAARGWITLGTKRKKAEEDEE